MRLEENNNWAADLAKMESLSSRKKILNICYVSSVFSLYMYG